MNNMVVSDLNFEVLILINSAKAIVASSAANMAVVSCPLHIHGNSLNSEINMGVLNKILLATGLGLGATRAFAAQDINWLDSAGYVVQDGDCLHTINWKTDRGCTAIDAMRVVNESTVLARGETPAAPMKQAEPVKTSPAPKYRQLSLTSGASFALGGSTLSTADKSGIAELASKLKGETILRVSIGGHTDDRGANAFNQRLSEKRASAVKAELVANGIDAGVISTVGYGESRPVASNSSREGRAKNRRVEIKIDVVRREF